MANASFVTMNFLHCHFLKDVTDSDTMYMTNAKNDCQVKLSENCFSVIDMTKNSILKFYAAEIRLTGKPLLTQ